MRKNDAGNCNLQTGCSAMQSKKNEVCYTLSYCLYTMSYPFINGIILQNYMVEFGVAESKVAFYVSVAQVFQLMTMLLFSKATDGLKNAIKVHGIMRLLILPMYILLAVFCLLRDVSADLLYLFVFGIGGAANLVIGFDSIVSYKVPAFAINEHGTVRSTDCNWRCCWRNRLRAYNHMYVLLSAKICIL